MNKIKDLEFKNKVYELVGDEYSVLGEYKRGKDKILMKHNYCGHEYLVSPDNFKRGRRCPKCALKKKGLKRRKTHSQFVNEVYDLVGDEYTIISEYTTALEKVTILHNKCNSTFSMIPGNFLNGQRCPKCSSCAKKTIDEIKNEVFAILGDEYLILGDIINTQIKIKLKHKTCGHEFDMLLSNMRAGQRCPRCGREKQYLNRKTKTLKKATINSFSKKTKSHDDFKKEVYDLYGDEYTVLSKYINNKTKVLIKHNICNHEYEVTPSNLLRGKRCPKCYGTPQKTTNQFIEEVYNLVGDEYIVIGEYITAETKIDILHKKCGHQFSMVPRNFLSGQRCPRCAGNKKKTHEEFLKEVYDLVKDEYIVMESYKNTNSKIKMMHRSCNTIFEVTPKHFLKGQRCPRCSCSKGEQKIIELLEKYNINYIHQFSYDDCIYKQKLKFDFAIFDNENENLKFLCEFDGEQHFRPVDYFGGKEGFYESKKRDNIKNKYVLDNNISLIRIPYWKYDNIHKILIKKLYRLKLIKRDD